MPKKTAETERTCIVTRVAKRADELIRFVVGPDGGLVPDIRRKLPGRGVWVSLSRADVETAERKRLFEKAFEGKVTVAPGLADRIDQLLLAAATGALSLARKAGTLIAGFGKVESALVSEPVVALVHATEAGADGVAKLAAAARRRFGIQPIPVIRCFRGVELDLAFGHTNVIHAALLVGPASDHVLARVAVLARFRGDADAPLTPGARPFDASTEVNDLSLRTLGTHV